MTETPDPTADGPAAEPARIPRPRIRTGAALWGLVLLAIAGAVLWTATSADRRAAALAAVLGLDGFGWTVVVLVAVGGIVTLVALAAVIRSGQKRLGADQWPMRDS